MTQLTQGSDMELREAINGLLVHLAYHHEFDHPDADQTEQPCKYLDDVEAEIMQLIQADKQRSIDRAVLDELKGVIDVYNHLEEHSPEPTVNLKPGNSYILRRLAELEQQLSPTTIEGGEDETE